MAPALLYRHREYREGIRKGQDRAEHEQVRSIDIDWSVGAGAGGSGGDDEYAAVANQAGLGRWAAYDGIAGGRERLDVGERCVGQAGRWAGFAVLQRYE